ncbi:Titin [Salix suchowensis]|nr:Titin [Salix suchowensis]
MELRSCSHLHFIQTAKGGKMMNMFRGKPALKFKELKDIYETGEAGNHHLLPVTRPKLELDDWSFDSDRAKTESPRVLAGATIKTESESPQSNCSSDGDGGKTESDDVDFGTMTLKQFKETYKTKKGKLSRNAGLIGQTSETCSPAKQEPSDSQFELEELTAMEPLSTWRSRIFKSRKKKRKSRLESSSSSSSESVPCIVKSKRKKSDQVVFQTSGILPAPIDIKVEVMEPISFDCRYATLINSSLCCGEPLASSLVVSSGEPEIADGCVLETGMLIASVEEPEIADGCVLETGMLIASVEEPETANDDGPQMSMFSSDEPQCYVANDQSYEEKGHVNPESILDVDASCGEILTVDTAEAIGFLSSDLSLSEIKEEDSVVDSHPIVDPAGVVSPIKGDSSIAYNDSQSEEPERVEDHGFETHKLAFFGNELQCYVVNEESYEPLEHADPKSMLHVRASSGEMRMVDVAELTADHKPERAEDHGFETHKSTFFSNDLQCCVVNQGSYEPVEHAVLKSMPDVRAPGGEITMVDVGELTTDHNSCLSSTELKKESFAAYPYPQNCGDNSIEVASPSKHHASDMGNESQDFPGMHELLGSKSDSQVQVPDISMVNTSQSTELSDRHGLHLSEDEAKDDIPLVEASVISSPVSGVISSRDSILCSGQDSCLASAAAEENKAPLSACGDAARKFSAIDEPVTLTNVQGCHHSKLQQLPEKLLSTRKAISPTSQKKLCKAMEASDLDDEEYYKYTRKLCYMNLNGYKIGRLGRASLNQRVDLTISPERITRKPKNDKNDFHHKGILKVPHPRTIPSFGTGCNSVQSCSESAISFSQKQMRDFESIATKLTKELNFMKDVVQESWHAKVYPATSLKYSADEVKIAVQNATRVEESARRWLSIMARDCNRFCKIMKLTDKASATSGNVVHKKKKIVFADEAGGKLCDVKTFENDTASVTGSSSDK